MNAICSYGARGRCCISEKYRSICCHCRPLFSCVEGGGLPSGTGSSGEHRVNTFPLHYRPQLKQAPTAQGRGGGGGDTSETSPLAKPHPSKSQLEAMVAAGDAFKGRLDVFEHNPREGVAIVGAGGSGRDAGGSLENFADAGGRIKVSTFDSFECGPSSSLLYKIQTP